MKTRRVNNPVRFYLAAAVWRLGGFVHGARRPSGEFWLPLSVSDWLFDRAEAIDERVAG